MIYYPDLPNDIDSNYNYIKSITFRNIERHDLPPNLINALSRVDAFMASIILSPGDRLSDLIIPNNVLYDINLLYNEMYIFINTKIDNIDQKRAALRDYASGMRRMDTELREIKDSLISDHLEQYGDIEINDIQQYITSEFGVPTNHIITIPKLCEYIFELRVEHADDTHVGDMYLKYRNISQFRANAIARYRTIATEVTYRRNRLNAYGIISDVVEFLHNEIR
jgi:hypothetical protein